MSDSRETVAPFFAALRKDFPSTLTLHAFAEAVLLVTAAHMGLKRTFRQRSFSSIFAGWPVLAAESAHRMPLADASELRSVFDPRSTVNVSLIGQKRLVQRAYDIYRGSRAMDPKLREVA